MVTHKIVLGQNRIYQFRVKQARVSCQFPVGAKWQSRHQVMFLRIPQQNIRQSRAPCFMRLKSVIFELALMFLSTLVKTKFLRGTPSQLGKFGL